MYEPYDYGDSMEDEGGYRVKPRGYQTSEEHEDLISSAPPRSLKKPARWVFISRKADIGIFLVLLLGLGFGTMWFISQLPFFVEAASNQYHWAMDVYATWGTPSMRWLFINLVVGVIVATSGLLSAFGGDRSPQEPDLTTTAYDKGVSYRGGSDPGVIYGGSDPAAQNGSEARFTGPGYESPLYNPYVDEREPAKSGRLHHQNSFEAWNHGSDNDDRYVEEDEGEEGFRDDRYRGRHPERNEPYARPVNPEVARAARPVSRQGSQRRGMPMPDEAPMPREMAFDAPPRDMPREVPMSREIPREMPHMESFRDVPRDMPPMEEPPPPREAPVSREIPVPNEDPAPEEVPPPPPPPPEPAPQPALVDHASGVGSSARKGDEIEIISKVYDSLPGHELEEVATEHGKFHRLNTDPAIHYSPPNDDASSDGGSPAKPEVLPKSHTFTLGRVLRRDQLIDFIEPLSRKLEGIGRKVRDPYKSSSQLDSAAAEAAAAQSGQQHRRRLSAESIPVVPSRRLAPESPEGVVPPIVIKHPFPSAAKKPSPPPSPILKQRSIVYPPALVSQASGKEQDLSPPGSPPIEKAMPPPPPPHLKLPSTKDNDSSSITSSEELPSFKFYIPPSISPEDSPAAKSFKKLVEKAASSEDRKPPSGKHSRTPSNIPAFTSSQPIGTAEAGSSSGRPDERSLVVKPGESNGGDQKVAEAKEDSAAVDKQEGSSGGKDDDLHQQIEDFLARFHENWRLQRQESLARYKKRLVELDE